jgi:capsular exopolysaccharide synthesis family protein
MKYPYSSYNTPLPGYGTSLVDRINLYLHCRRYFKLIAERWLLLVICSSAGLGLGSWLAFTKPDVYQARSLLSVPPRISMNSSKGVRMEDDYRNFADSQLTLMESGPVIQNVLAKLQEGRENTNKLAKPELTKALAGRGNTFVLTVESTNFDYAQKFASTWADEFIQYKKRQKLGIVNSAEAATTRQILEQTRQLDQTRDELNEFKKKYNIANQRDAGQALREQLQRYKDEEQSYLNGIKLFEGASPKDIASGGVNLPDNLREKARSKPSRDLADDESNPNRFEGGSDYTRLTIELSRLETRRSQLDKTLKDKHPAIQQLDREIELIQNAIKKSLDLVEQMRVARIEGLKRSAAAYPALIEELTKKSFDTSQIENDYDQLIKKEAAIKNQLDLLYQQERDVAQMNSDEDVFNILDQGVGDTKPVRPQRPLIIIGGLLVGTIVGAGILFLLHRLDDRLETPEDFEEQLEEPILGQLPEVEKKHYKEGYLLLTRMKTHTMFAESLRGVRSALLLSPEGTSKRMLAVTSAVPGDGKTTFTTNFSVTLAHAGNRTLLIDADLRRGNIHGYFEQPLEGGLSEVLQGKLTWKEAVRETGIQNLSFMRAGERPANPSELLIGPATKELIMQLRQEFDYVVFDCPPLTAIDDTFSIAAYLDGLFFVVRAGRTSIRFARMGLNTVRQRGAPILGLIVNGVPIDNPYYYYTTYYYASYYHRPLATSDTMFQDRQRKQVEVDVPGDSNTPGLPDRKSGTPKLD